MDYNHILVLGTEVRLDQTNIHLKPRGKNDFTKENARCYSSHIWQLSTLVQHLLP
jgi:hypothetical protein